MVQNRLEMSETKIILDACCGSRMFWFDKHNPFALFVDKRSETLTAKDRGKTRIIEIKPIREAAIELHKAGWINYIDIDTTKKLLGLN